MSRVNEIETSVFIGNPQPIKAMDVKVSTSLALDTLGSYFYSREANSDLFFEKLFKNGPGSTSDFENIPNRIASVGNHELNVASLFSGTDRPPLSHLVVVFSGVELFQIGATKKAVGRTLRHNKYSLASSLDILSVAPVSDNFED